VDLVPAARGDASGVGLFFYAMPVLPRNDHIHRAAPGSHVDSTQEGRSDRHHRRVRLGVRLRSSSIIGRRAGQPVLIVHAFLLTQTIGWLTTAVALLAKHHFMPVAMTFVLILGIPTAGGSVPPDMLPAALGALHQILPFGQFIDLVRSSAYFGGHDTVRPFLTLLGWIAAAATLFAFAARRANRPAPARTA
jgi:hypothetical protein